MSIVKEYAAAKLNLCLTVGDILPNGYHALESVMQTVSLCDTISVSKADEISLACSAPYIPTDSRNLAHKAATLFFKESGISGGAHIHIAKRIPVCAGMGGGSTDAAATLRALNKLYGKPFTLKQLCAMSSQLGADVPFCVRGGTAYVTGVGDKIQPLPHLPLHYVLIFDKTPLSTPKMYAKLDAGVKAPSNAAACMSAVAAGDKQSAAALAANSFLAVATEACPAVAENISTLLAHGAAAATITGKGPTAVGVFTSRSAAVRCVKSIKKATICKSVPPVE